MVSVRNKSTWKFEYTGDPEPHTESLWGDDSSPVGPMGSDGYKKMMTFDVLNTAAFTEERGDNNGPSKTMKIGKNPFSSPIQTIPTNATPDEIIAIVKGSMYRVSQWLLQIDAADRRRREVLDSDLYDEDSFGGRVHQGDLGPPPFGDFRGDFGPPDSDPDEDDDGEGGQVPVYRRNDGDSGSHHVHNKKPESFGENRRDGDNRADKENKGSKEGFSEGENEDDQERDRDDEDREQDDGYDGPPEDEDDDDSTMGPPPPTYHDDNYDRSHHTDTGHFNNMSSNAQSKPSFIAPTDRMTVVFRAFVKAQNNKARWLGSNNKLTRLKFHGGMERVLRLKMNWAQFDAMWNKLDSARSGDLDLEEFRTCFGDLDDFANLEGTPYTHNICADVHM